MIQTRSDSGSGKPLGIWLSVVALSLLLGFVLLPSLQTHFFSDDFTLLVESQSLPLTQADDQLHRPLRNIAFKLAERALGVDPLPYRIAVLVTYLLFLGTIGWLLRCVQVREPWAVLCGVAFVAFFPRNHSALFWFAASQDVVVAWLAVLCCALFLRYRERGGLGLIAASALAFAMALGFKETAIIVPGLVLVVDILARRPKIPELRARSFWQPYTVFVAVAAVYTAYFIVDSGAASLAGHKTAGYYNAGGPLIVARAFLRLIANLMLPFSYSFSLSQMTAWRALLLVVIVAVIGRAGYKAGQLRFPVAALAWILIAATPVAVFAHFFITGADHYLLLPLAGAALAIAGLSQPVFERSRTRAAVAVALLFVYCGFGAYRLIEYRAESRAAAAYFGDSVTSVLAVAPPLLSGSEVYVVGLMHDWKHYPVTNNGFLGGLESRGFPPASKLLYNFADDTEEERTLQTGLLACPTDTGALSAHARVLLVNADATPAMDRSGPCGLNLIRADREKRPEAWFPLPKP
jgi:hypothetical protein